MKRRLISQFFRTFLVVLLSFDAGAYAADSTALVAAEETPSALERLGGETPSGRVEYFKELLTPLTHGSEEENAVKRDALTLLVLTLENLVSEEARTESLRQRVNHHSGESKKSYQMFDKLLLGTGCGVSLGSVIAVLSHMPAEVFPFLWAAGGAAATAGMVQCLKGFYHSRKSAKLSQKMEKQREEGNFADPVAPGELLLAFDRAYAEVAQRPLDKEDRFKAIEDHFLLKQLPCASLIGE